MLKRSGAMAATNSCAAGFWCRQAYIDVIGRKGSGLFLRLPDPSLPPPPSVVAVRLPFLLEPPCAQSDGAESEYEFTGLNGSGLRDLRPPRPGVPMAANSRRQCNAGG